MSNEDLDALEDRINGSYDLCHIRSHEVTDVIARLREAERSLERYKRMNPKRAVTKLREAESVINEVRDYLETDEGISLTPMMPGRIILDILTTYKPTEEES